MKESSTICWNCVNACGDCSWSESFVPVPGWKAREVIRERVETKDKLSYVVAECPQFEQSTPEKDMERLMKNMTQRKDPRVFGGKIWKLS